MAPEIKTGWKKAISLLSGRKKNGDEGKDTFSCWHEG